MNKIIHLLYVFLRYISKYTLHVFLQVNYMGFIASCDLSALHRQFLLNEEIHTTCICSCEMYTQKNKDHINAIDLNINFYNKYST